MTRNTSLLTAMALVMAMFGLVDISAEKEIIFPEISALAIGFWIMEKPPWRGSPLVVWASPSLAALTGVALFRYVPLPAFVLIGCAFVLVVVQLKLMRSEVFPSISAAILAILTETTSWQYPLSVSMLMAVIVLGKLAGEHFVPDRIWNAAAATDTDPENGLGYWSKIFCGVLAITALALGSGHLFMIAPPLIVAFIELSRPHHPLRRAPMKTVALLFAAAITGVLWFYVIVTALDGPLWLFGGLALGTVFVLYRAFGTSFPPVAAIALLPVLVPACALWSYPLHVLAGAMLFVSMGVFIFDSSQVRARK
ncbi:MAG: HPP family protein [Deltaproteobacteria bacterium]|nr:HPP family protein [Deltaproteobacteria bacterium]